MAVERRFLLASSLARLIQRESAPSTRILEGHFAPHPTRTQFVRVERDRALLVLLSRAEEGSIAEEEVEVPRAHAEALIDVAAGTVAFDRTPIRLGEGVDAVLDRFILPQGIDLIAIKIHSDPRAFAPPLWVGAEVTGDPSLETSGLALAGIPTLGEVEVSNAAIEALLDLLEGSRS